MDNQAIVDLIETILIVLDIPERVRDCILDYAFYVLNDEHGIEES